MGVLGSLAEHDLGCSAVQQVAKNFREIFAQLAVGGKGELVMQKRLRPENDENDDDMDGERRQDQGVEKYAGVKIRVCAGTDLIVGWSTGTEYCLKAPS